MDCWEYKNCDWTEECPAFPDHGDCCVVKHGTLCCESHDLIEKMTTCVKCSFYKSEYFNKERAEAIIDGM